MEAINLVIKKILDRVAEIIWWNRGLTKLDNSEYFTNYKEFVKKQLISIQGPYIEFISPPKSHEVPTREFLTNLHFDPRVIETIIRVLFKKMNLHLYEHQAQAIKKIVAEHKDVILSVPTATGKTEAFFLPILDYCVKTEKPGLKALIVYPMKTLEIDQLNRFIKYLYTLNDLLEDGRTLKIGIWDGDTPPFVGDPERFPGAIPSDSYYRGMVCPICNNKLRINSSGYLYCIKLHSFDWIMVTRETISNNMVDILITNPEAIDFLSISPAEDRKIVIGSYASHFPLKYIVFDEIHIWTGLGGASIKLFIERLRSFYKKSDPQLILLSATVKDPDKLIKTFTSSENGEAIEFSALEISESSSPDFTRLKPCNFEDLIKFLCIIKNGNNQAENLRKLFPGYENLKSTSEMLCLISQDQTNGLKIENDDIGLFLDINFELDLNHAQKFGEFLSELLDNYAFKEKWRDIIINKMPEVSSIINYSYTNSEKPIKFIAYHEISEYIQAQGVLTEKCEDVIEMCLNFGRIADLLNDRYHIFLKTKENIYWCAECKKLIDFPFCEENHNVRTLLFCRNCHEVFYFDPENIKFDGSSYPYPSSLKKCPTCRNSLRNFYDLGVPYTTFISFLISAACRIIPSKKILIFSDGRANAEKIGGNLIKYDYNLVTEQLLLKLLIDSGGSMNSRELYFKLTKMLHEFYTKDLKDETLERNAEEIINDYQKQNIFPLSRIQNMKHSFEEAMITAKVVYQLTDDIDIIIAHEILKIFTSQWRNLRFTKNYITFMKGYQGGITLERLNNKLKSRLFFANSLIDKKTLPIIRLFLEENIITVFAETEINDIINRQKMKNKSKITDNKEQQTREYLEGEKKILKNYLERSGSEIICKSGVLTREFIKNDFDVQVVAKVIFCCDCYTSYPIIKGTIKNCPVCSSTNIKIDSRLNEYQEDGEIQYNGLGYLRIPSNWDFNIDHWASDILAHSIESEGKKIQKVSIGVHRAGIPYSLRGIIEEGFRKFPPSINAISSTPTLELGIDIGSLDMISIIGIPPLLTNYIQRAGRTGRVLGKPSYVFNIIRNNHSVDNYYYDNLNEYFREFKPIFVPNPKDFDIIYVSHVISIICRYLARNPDRNQVYSKIFRLENTYLSPENYYKEVLKRFHLFMRLVRTEKRTELENLLRTNYDEKTLTIFNRLFFDEDDNLFLLNIALRFFGKLEPFKADHHASEKLSEIYRSFDWWFSILGLIANYRGSLNLRMPIFIPRSKYRESEIELKELGRIIRENFPGPQNEDGALFRVETSRYIVEDVHGSSSKLIDTAIKACSNKLCPLLFIPFLGAEKKCLYCNTELKEFMIYGLNMVKVKPARYLGDAFETYPHEVIYPEIILVKDAIKGKFFNLKAKFEYGELKVTKSTLAFDKQSSRGGEPKLTWSQGFIEGISKNEDDTFDPTKLSEDISLEDLNKIKPKFHPIGLKFQTLGLKISINVEEVMKKIIIFQDKEEGEEEGGERADVEDKEDDLVFHDLSFIVIYSIQQAFKKMVSIYSESDLGDFEVCFNISKKKINFYLLDNCEGGSGITKRVFKSLVNDFQIYSILETGILNCENCITFCSSCLLIERTPDFIVKNGLLNRKLLKGIYYADFDMTETDSRMPGITAASIKDEQETYWKRMISEGETNFVEFKQTLFYDIHQKNHTKIPEQQVAIAISTFLNTHGGKLLIGVKDDGEIFGLQKDYVKYKEGQRNSDRFLIGFTDVINNYLGPEFHQYVIPKIVLIDEKPVCIVVINKARKPAYFKKGNEEKFFIRGPAGKVELKLNKAIEYINDHWPANKQN